MVQRVRRANYPTGAGHWAWLVFPGTRGSCVPRPIESGTACFTYGAFFDATAGKYGALGGASRVRLTTHPHGKIDAGARAGGLRDALSDRYMGLTVVNRRKSVKAAPCEIWQWQPGSSEIRGGQRCAKQEAAFHVSAIALLCPCK